jgi:UDP-N-acetylmuramyl pentapeptide phosphotransferase/UDP-N-acetylglucosamine-1-phosphate transferase
MPSIIKRPLAVTVAAWYLIGIYAYAMIEVISDILTSRSSSTSSIGGWIYFVVIYGGSLMFPINSLRGMGAVRWGGIILFFSLFCDDFAVTREKCEALGLIFAAILIYLPASNEFFRLSDIRRTEERSNKRRTLID